MLFIYPMWDHESQRIGKQICTPLGYALHAFAELFGFIGLLTGFGVIIYLAYLGIVGKFERSHLWFLTIPFGIGVFSEIVYQISWLLASRKGFRYDDEKREASWQENGKRVTYNYTSEPN